MDILEGITRFLLGDYHPVFGHQILELDEFEEVVNCSLPGYEMIGQAATPMKALDGLDALRLAVDINREFLVVVSDLTPLYKDPEAGAAFNQHENVHLEKITKLGLQGEKGVIPVYIPDHPQYPQDNGVRLMARTVFTPESFDTLAQITREKGPDALRQTLLAVAEVNDEFSSGDQLIVQLLRGEITLDFL